MRTKHFRVRQLEVKAMYRSWPRSQEMEMGKKMKIIKAETMYGTPMIPHLPSSHSMCAPAINTATFFKTGNWMAFCLQLPCSPTVPQNLEPATWGVCMNESRSGTSSHPWGVVVHNWFWVLVLKWITLRTIILSSWKIPGTQAKCTLYGLSLHLWLLFPVSWSSSLKTLPTKQATCLQALVLF